MSCVSRFHIASLRRFDVIVVIIIVIFVGFLYSYFIGHYDWIKEKCTENSNLLVCDKTLIFFSTGLGQRLRYKMRRKRWLAINNNSHRIVRYMAQVRMVRLIFYDEMSSKHNKYRESYQQTKMCVDYTKLEYVNRNKQKNVTSP